MRLRGLYGGLPLSVYAWIAQEVAFHAAGLAFEWCDRTGAMRRLKVRSSERKPYLQLLPKVLLNQFLILLPAMVLAEATGLCFTGSARLSPLHFLLSLPAMAVGHDVVQYIAHRHLLHNPAIYLMRTLKHSVHHSTSASRGISACYMSGADFFLEIVLPYLIPLMLVGGGGADVRFHLLIASLGAIGGVYEHSGYDLAVLVQGASPSPTPSLFARIFDGLVNNRAHGAHHSRSNVSFSDGFGSPGICDTLFGTRWDIVAKRRELAEKEWKAQRAKHEQNGNGKTA